MKNDVADLLSGTKALLADIDEAACKLGYKDAEDMRRSREEGIAKGIYTLAKPGVERRVKGSVQNEEPDHRGAGREDV